MVAGTVPIKTPAGQAELSTRERRVSQRHRTVLFLVDGKRGADEVRRMAAQAGVPEHCFEELLALGLIMLPDRTYPLQRDPSGPPSVFHVDLPLQGPDSVNALAESELPASRTLYPSLSTDSTLGDAATQGPWLPSDTNTGVSADPAVVEARSILSRAVRAEAPLAGSLTLIRLRRAHTRADLAALLEEVESRINKPHRALAAAQTLRRVRFLLDGRVDSSLEPA